MDGSDTGEVIDSITKIFEKHNVPIYIAIPIVIFILIVYYKKETAQKYIRYFYNRYETYKTSSEREVSLRSTSVP